MSLYDKMLIGFGSGFGVKAGTLFNLKPIDGLGDFTVSRNDANGTIINDSGLIEGVLANVPRSNYPIGGSVNGCPSLLMEPEAIQLIPFSDDFNNAAWLKSDLTTNNDVQTSPDGTTNADELIEGVGAGGHTASEAVVLVAGNNVISVFMKKSTRQYTAFQIDGAGSGGTTMLNFDLNNGTVAIAVGSAVSFGVQDYGNGWYRGWIVKNASGGAATMRIYTMNGPAYANRSYTGDGVSGTYVWGANIVAGDYIQNYIQTLSGSLTRLPDQVNNAGNALLFNDSEGVLYLKISALGNDSTFRVASLSDNSTSDYIELRYENTSNDIKLTIQSGGVLQAFLFHALADETVITHIAARWQINNFSLWVNGVEVGTDVSGATPIGLIDFGFSQYGTGGNPFYGNCEEMGVFEYLTDLEMIELTT